MAKIPPEKVEEIRSASDIVQVASDYLTLRKQGKNYFGLCPFHTEKSPSFSVNPELQIFHCFGCGAGGNIFTFVMQMEKVTFPEAVKLLAGKAGITIPEEDQNIEELREKEALYYVNKLARDFFSENLQSASGKTARDYMEKRGFDNDKLKFFDIGYAPNQWDTLLTFAQKKSVKPELLLQAGLVLKNENGRYYDRFRGRITFSIHSSSGQVVGFGARRLGEDNTPKYINSPETQIYQKRYILYGLHWARESIRKFDTVIIVEGYTDLTSLYSIGIKHVVATSGTSLTEEHAKLLRRYASRAILLYDSDSAGSAAALRGADILMENGFEVKICQLEAGQDPDSFAQAHDQKEVKKKLEHSVSLLDYKIARLDKNPQHRAEATKELLGSIAKVSDVVQRTFLVKELAEKLVIEENILWAELKKLGKNRTFFKKEDSYVTTEPDDRFFKTKRGAAELQLLEVILLNPELAPKVMSVVSFSDFKNQEIARLYRAIENDIIQTNTFDARYYLATIQDPFIAKSISNNFTNQNVEISKRLALDCIVSLFSSNIREEIEQTRNEMKERQSQGLSNKELVNQWNHLIKRKKAIESKEFIDVKTFFDS